MLKVFKNGNKLKATEVYYSDTKSLLDIIYPIGRGFIDFTNTDYSNYLGFTWEKELVGMTPIGKDSNDTDFDTVGKTGGEKKHTLTDEEMPSHNHNPITMSGNYLRAFAPDGAGLGSIDLTSLFTTNKKDNNNFVTNASGGGQSHNNLQPYKVVNFWKRTA